MRASHGEAIRAPYARLVLPPPATQQFAQNTLCADSAFRHHAYSDTDAGPSFDPYGRYGRIGDSARNQLSAVTNLQVDDGCSPHARGSRGVTRVVHVKPRDGERQFLDVDEDQVVCVGLRPAGAWGVAGGVLVAVGEAGDADDGPGRQGAPADRRGDRVGLCAACHRKTQRYGRGGSPLCP